MRDLIRLKLIGIAAAGLLWPAALLAQSAPRPAAAKPADESAVLMSPFQVDATRDTGFVAASSLAGGRLAGELKDTPASYSVQTREFIDALQLIDLSDAAKWSVSGQNVPDNGNNEVYGAPSQISFRGGSGAGTQRDFFRFSVNYDSYNLERYDYARGPNAVLFGSADYSGSVIAVTRKARTDRDFSELRVAYGSWENLRVAADVNATRGRKLAVRLDVLHQDRAGWRNFEAERKRAATLDTVMRPWANTEVRLQGEMGLIQRNNPLTTFNDRFTGWDGKTTFSALLPNSLPSDAAAKGYARYGSSTTPFFVYAPAFGGVLNVAQSAQTLGGNNSATTPVGGVLVVGPTANVAAQPFNESLNLPASRFDNAIAGSKFRYPSRSFAVSSDNPTYAQQYRTFSAFVTQKLGNQLFAEVDANVSKERRTTEYLNTRGLVSTYIDINQNLTNGTPNPEYLQPYGEGYRLRIRVGSVMEGARASLAWLPAPTKWGTFSLTGSYEYSFSEYVTQPFSFTVHRNADPRLWANNDYVYYRYYWDRGGLPTPEPDTVSYGGVNYQTGWVNDISFASPAINQTTLETSQAAAKAKLLQGRLHLLAAVRRDSYLGHNKVAKLQGDYPTDWQGGGYLYRPAAPADYAQLTYVVKDANGVPSGVAQPAITRPRSGIARLAQYANDRFQDDYSPPDVNVSPTTYTLGGVGYLLPSLSAFYNYSTSFNPNPSRQSIFGYFYGPQVASEWSAGLRQVVAGGRLSLSLGYYKGQQSNQVFDPGANYQTDLNNILQASPRGTTTTPASNLGNVRGVPLVPRFFDSRDLSNHGWEFELVANPARGWRITFNAALARAYQQNSYRDFRSYVTSHEAVLRQILADSGVAINAATGLAAPDTTIPSNLQSPNATAAATAWNNIRTNLANAAVGPQFVTRLPLLMSNLFTDYEFRDGWLKGWKVGAGANYRGRQAVGYRGADTVVDPANATQAIDDPNATAYDPVYVKGYVAYSAVLGYRFKLRDHPVSLDLKVDNVFNYSQPLYYSTVQRPVNGALSSPARVATPAALFYLTPRNYTLSASVKF